MVGRNRNPPWSDLPQELLSTIANFLTSNPISIFTFRSVCRSWRSSCPPLSNSPLLSPLLPLSIPSTSYHSFDYSPGHSILSVTVIYALYRPLQLPQPEPESSSPDAWILFVDEFTPGKPSIRKPFSNCSYFTPINFPNNVNLIDSNVRELGRFHSLSYSTYYDRILECKLSKLRFCVTDLNKVVMFPNVSTAITLRDDGTLGMYRFEVGGNEGIIECENKHDGKGFRFDDIVEYKGRVLGIDRRGRVYEIEYHSTVITPFVLPIAGGGGRRKRLVESLGLLYLVVRCKEEFGNTEKRPKFKVYELNEGRKKWCEIASLGDRCFSFGPNFSFSASAQELGTYLKNCILFVKYSFQTYRGYDDDYKEFSKLNNSELDIGVWHLGDTDHGIESNPDNSDSLWPPPSWIWNVDRVLGIDRRDRVYQINYHSSELTPFVAPIAGGSGRRKRLVESLGRLYLVVRCYVDRGDYNKMVRLKVKKETRNIKFKVYELNEGKKKWIEVSSLGDRSFSFGRNFSFSASDQELGTCVKNCIFFTRHSFLSYSWNGDDFTGFKKCELDIGVCHLNEADHFGDIESYPGYSDSLWPPPNWIWSIDRLNRITILETAIEGMLDKVPENYKTDVERADDPKPAVLEFVKAILKLKKLVIKFHEEEIACKNKLQQAMDKLNQVDDLFEQIKTWSHATTEETYGSPDFYKMRQACHESFLHSTLGILHMDSHLFSIEEVFTEMEMSLTSRLAPLVKLAQ